jgi:NarL family two-component system sensor histidine kinase LiaS
MLTIRDDGRGFDPHLAGMPNPSRHFGLRQMRERIQDLGGTLDIYAAVGHGTELSITLPPLPREVEHGSNPDPDRR